MFFNVRAEEISSVESYEQIGETDNLSDDMGGSDESEVSENADNPNDYINNNNIAEDEELNADNNGADNSGEIDTVIIEENTENEEINSDDIKETEETEKVNNEATESTTEINTSESSEEMTEESEAEIDEAAEEDTVPKENTEIVSEVMSDKTGVNNGAVSDGSSGSSNNSDKINGDKAENISTETTTEAVTENLFDAIAGLNKAGETTHTVTLILNGGSLNDEKWSENNKVVPAGGSLMLPESEPVQEGAEFMGWSDNPNDNTVKYKTGEEIKNITQNINLYAVWQWEKFKVNFKQNVDDENVLWETEVEYGYTLWTDRSLTPWTEVTDWAEESYDDNGQPVYTANVNFNNDMEGEPVYVEVTKRQNEYISNDGITNTYVYYTFVYNNTKWFTAPDGIAPVREGFTFRDWYMTEPVAGGMEVTANTVYTARYMDTGGYVANVNYKYENKKTADDSKSFVLEYDRDSGKENIEFEFTASEIEGYYPTIKSSSGTGIELYDSEGNVHNVPPSGLELYTDIKEIKDENGNVESIEYVYKVIISIDASFTTPEGSDIEEGEEAGIHCITFNIEYHPSPTGYRVNYYKELLGDDSTQHSVKYELYEYISVVYDSENKSWKKSRYTPAEGAVLEIKEQTTYYEYNKYDEEVIGTITQNEEGYHKDDTVIPENKEYSLGEDGTEKNKDYEGFIIGDGSFERTETGVVLSSKTEENNINLYYSRRDYHMYYITDSEASSAGNVLYVYGAKVGEPDAVTKTGYKFAGWTYYKDIPQSNSDNTGILLNGNGLKPDIMPAMDVFAKARWEAADTTYTVNVWLEAANYNDYVKEFQVTVNSTTGSVIKRNAVIDVLNENGGSDTEGNVILTAINSYTYTDGTTFGSSKGQHFTFNDVYTGNDRANEENITVKSDGSTEFNVVYDRKWYVLEMVLGRSYAEGGWWSATHYQVATNTGSGKFNDGTTWSDAGNVNELPYIKYNNAIDINGYGDYTYYKLNNEELYTEYPDGDKKYLGPYGLYTDKHTIEGYNCAVYYIYAKYEADISELWPANGNSIYIEYPNANQTYISMGTNEYSGYRAVNTSNPNILNVYSTMSDEILKDNGGNILNNGKGYKPKLNVDGKPITDESDVNINHRMISYWNSAKENHYYRLIEALDGTVSDKDVTFTFNYNDVGGTGGGKNVNKSYFNEGDIVKWNNKYYIVTGEPMTQYTSNTLVNQTQPALQGFESMGKAFYNSGNDSGNLYFLYDRERYNVTLNNVKGAYYPPISVLDEKINGNTSLKEQGFEMTDIQNTDGINCGTLTVKYGTDCTYLKYLTDYLLDYGRNGTDTDDHDNYLGLRYANQTRGTKEWVFDDWYQDSSYEVKAWDVTYCKSAYSDFVLYAKWDPPEYNLNIHLGAGEYDDSERKEGYIWKGADISSDKKADVKQNDEGYIYTTSEGEGSIVYVPYPPSADGCRFIGWYYFDTNRGTESKVYLEDIITDYVEGEYKEGYTYIDYFGRVRLIKEDVNGFYYDDNIRGLRYIFGETSPIYGEVNVYAVYESYDAEKYNVLHVIEKSELKDKKLEPKDGWDEVTINGKEYYMFEEESFTGREPGQTYTTEAVFGQYITGDDGTNYYMFADAESRNVRMYRNPGNNHYPKGEEKTDNVYVYDETGNTNGIFYLEDENSLEGSRYTYYVLFKYSIVSELPYTVWYVDIDEARSSGELTDEEGDHPYYSRYETPKNTGNVFLLPSEERTVTLDVGNDSDITVVETAKDISGYTLLGEYQTNLNLLARGRDNNIYFYYRKQSDNATYNIRYHIMEDNKYSSDKYVEIKYMPGISGTEAKAEVLAEYYERYISEAVNSSTEIGGKLPEITAVDGSNEYYLNVEGKEDSADIEEICVELLRGGINDTKSSTPYILVTSAEGGKTIDVYMRYGSVKIIKYNDEGDKLEGAEFKLTLLNDDGEETKYSYRGVTDGSGEYVFYNLWIDENYTYKLVETTAPGKDYQLLKEPINIKLPFTSTEELNGEYDFKDEDGVYYWYDINCEVTDSVKFDLPVTGGKFNVGVIGTGMGMIFISVILLIGLNKNRDRRKCSSKNIKIKNNIIQERGAIMKNSKNKRILAALCSVVMLLSVFMVNAGADVTIDTAQKGSITIIKKAVDGATDVNGVEFSYVKIADAIQHSENGKNGENTTVTSSLMFKLTAEGENIFAGMTPDATVTGVDGYDLYYASTLQNKLNDGIGEVTYTNKGTVQMGQVKFDNLDVGIYLVDETNTAGATDGDGNPVVVTNATGPFLVSIPTTVDGGNSWEYDVEINAKNILATDKPTKIPSGDAIINMGDSINPVYSADIGSEFTYTITGNIVKTTEGSRYSEYTLTDTPDEGITYGTPGTPGLSTLKVKLGTDKESAVEMVKGTDYTLEYPLADDALGFKITLTDDGIAKINDDSLFVGDDKVCIFVEYSAFLNENATSDGNNNKNAVNISYKHEDVSVETETETEVTIYTYGIDLTKYFVTNGTDTPDPRKVTFKLTDEEGDVIYFGKLDGTAGDLNTYVINKQITEANEDYTENMPCAQAAAGTSAEGLSDITGVLHIHGLAAGTYMLTEVTTDEGYSLLKEPIEITIEQNNAEVTVRNEKQSIFTLPLTGGSGTWIYTVGGMALIGAALFMVSKVGKKKTA